MHFRPLAALLVVGLTPTEVDAAIAFVGLDGLGLENSTVQPIERLLKRALADLTGAEVLSPDDVTAALLDPRLERLRSCSGELDCLVDLGGVLEVEAVIYGTLTRLGKHFVVVLKLIATEASTEKSRVRQVLTGEKSELVDAVRAAAVKLLDPDAYRAALVVDRMPPTATVTVDGEAVGIKSGRPVTLITGRHAIQISAEGYRTKILWIDVGLHEIAHIDGQLEWISGAAETHGVAVTFTRSPLLGRSARWLGDSWPTAALSLGVANLTAGGTLGYLAHAKAGELERAFRARSAEPGEIVAMRRRGAAYDTWARISLGLGGALGAAGALGWLLDAGGEPSESDRPNWLQLWARPLVLGAGGTATAAGGVLGFLAWRQQESFERAYRRRSATQQELSDQLDRGRSLALWAKVGLATGTALISAGVLDWMLDMGGGE